MFVINRHNQKEEVSFDKILNRIRGLSNKIPQLTHVDSIRVTHKVIEGLYDGMNTSELDEISSFIASSMNTIHPEYSQLGSRICISNLHKNTTNSILECYEKLYTSGQINDEFIELIRLYHQDLQNMLNFDRDYLFDYFGYKTLEKMYLMKIGNDIIERPQFMFMRVSLGIHKNNIQKVKETYDLMSNKYFIHATPTLFNTGAKIQQLLSCFLIGTDDSVDGMYSTLLNMARISKGAGGIGYHISNIRAKGSIINSSNGKSTGIIPYMRVMNDFSEHITQSGRRPASVAVYLEPHHAEIMDFLNVRKNTGNEKERTRELFTALWISDLFMERVEKDRPWSLFSPDTAKDLENVHGEEYKKLYKKYEMENRAVSIISARKIWDAVINSLIETGTPYILYKDTANRRSNQQNLGTIKSSNLCVAPETKILTDKGYFEIKDLENQTVNVWNGEEFTETTVKKTSDNSELIKITFSNSQSIECTRYHKFYIQEFGKIDAENLCIGYKLIKYKLPFDEAEQEISVENIEITNRFSETYCFTEKNRSMGIFNGIIAGNCTEIIEYSDSKEYACCTLASISLPAFITRDYHGKYYFNHQKLAEVAGIITENLDNIIDINMYPCIETEISNKRHRPLGIGIQGLADTFMMLGYPFESLQARKLNKEIMETIYYGSMKRSMELAKERGKYSTFDGSPLSKGLFQFNLANAEGELSGRWNFDELRDGILKYGVRNSLLLAPMPTASTSNILGNTECFEPITNNIYVRRTTAGEFVYFNKYLINKLIEHNLWNNEMRTKIISERGKITNIPEIPVSVKELFLTSWEISKKSIIEMARDRGYFICQSQSMNLYFDKPDYKTITTALFYGWKQGLKTGCYYTRIQPAVEAQQFTIEPTIQKNVVVKVDEECTMCSS